MKVKKYTLVLGSSSPRRQQLLEYLDIPFLIRSPDVDENSDCADPKQFVENASKIKAKNVFDTFKEEEFFSESLFPFVIGADTIVSIDNKILGKPKDIFEAEKILKKLSGKEHDVVTGVTLCFLDKNNKKVVQNSFTVKTNVLFDHISDELLGCYLNSHDSLDKAGAYGVQGQAQAFIKSLNGSYSNVMGLPVCEVVENIKKVLNKNGTTIFLKDEFH